MRPDLVIDDRPAQVAGDLVADRIRSLVSATGRCRLAVPGGSTPAPLFRRLIDLLTEAELGGVTLGFVDERHLSWDGTGLPPADSNLRVAVDTGLAERVGSVVPLLHPGLPLDAAADRADAAVRALGGFDVVVLGAGPDGHVASIFPGHPSLESARGDRSVIAVRDSPKPPPERLSLTLTVLASAGHTVLVARGAAKSAVLRRAWQGDTSLPLTLAAPAGTWTWVLDPEAASTIQGVLR